MPRESLAAEVVPAKNRDARTKASQRELRDLSVQNRLWTTLRQGPSKRPAEARNG